jgi:hypothetical protein
MLLYVIIKFYIIILKAFFPANEFFNGSNV